MTFGNGDAEDQVYCLDYRPDGDQFAASGKDPAIKVIDDATKAVVTKMKGGDGHGIMSLAGHSEPRVLDQVAPGGRERRVLGRLGQHDPDLGRACRPLHALDLRPARVWRLLDFGGQSSRARGAPRSSCRRGTTARASSSRRSRGRHHSWAARCRASFTRAQFSKETSAPGAAGPARPVAAGGSGACEARVFDMAAPRNTDGAPALVGTIAGMARGIFSVDWAPPVLDAHGDLAPSRVALAGGDSTVRIVELEKRPDDDMIRPGTSTVRVAGVTQVRSSVPCSRLRRPRWAALRRWSRVAWPRLTARRRSNPIPMRSDGPQPPRTRSE